MSKKKLLEFGLKEADAFQKNFKIFFDRLVRGYRSMMGKDPEGLDLLKVKMEAREKALNTTKVVNQKGLTLDPDKPIVGGTQEGIPTIRTKFDEELDEFNLTKDDPMGDLEKIVKGEGETGLPKKEAPQGVKDILEEELGVKLYGDETFDELMIIKNTGKHPRDMADGGRIGFALGGESIIGKDISTIGGIMGTPTTEEEDEFSGIKDQTAALTLGLGLSAKLAKTFGPVLGKYLHTKIKQKPIDILLEQRKKQKNKEIVDRAKQNINRREIAAIQAKIDKDPRGYDGSRGPSANPYGGGGGGLHSGYADGGLATMFVEKR